MKFEVVAAQSASDDSDALVHELAAFFESDAIVGKVLAPGTKTCTETARMVAELGAVNIVVAAAGISHAH